MRYAARRTPWWNVHPSSGTRCWGTQGWQSVSQSLLGESGAWSRAGHPSGQTCTPLALSQGCCLWAHPPWQLEPMAMQLGPSCFSNLPECRKAPGASGVSPSASCRGGKGLLRGIGQDFVQAPHS